MPDPEVFYTHHVPSGAAERDIYAIDSTGEDIVLVSCQPLGRAERDSSGNIFGRFIVKSTAYEGSWIIDSYNKMAKVYFPNSQSGIVDVWYAMTLLRSS